LVAAPASHKLFAVETREESEMKRAITGLMTLTFVRRRKRSR
jgi:hypothetical protein